ncbi:MAG: glutamyl-tRNA reductase [Candidatus Firestonebacteria bacterium RIFOXYC2_FULL_39_67]|nr:MAG: glutamyl-tRNA reductase [Candidatus Firestonebacteria bacterium RIFOXYC2_FULL_39_67]
MDEKILEFAVLGVSYKTASIAVRERIALTGKTLHDGLAGLCRQELIKEAMILSTCNRFEVYVAYEAGKDDSVKVRLQEILELKQYPLQSGYWFTGQRAVLHLFRVASSLDSQVIGENQILGQLTRAYLKAKDAGTINYVLDMLMQKAVSTGKRVRTETGISNGNISIGKLAVKMVEKDLDNLQDRRILIIGAGETAETVVNYLKERNAAAVLVSNRTYSKACILAAELQGRAVKFDQIEKELPSVDIILSSTSARHLVLRKDRFELLVRKDKLIIFDLAVPRDIDPGIGGLKGVKLYNIDELGSVVEENYKKRLVEAGKAEAIIEQEMVKVYSVREPVKCQRLINLVQEAVR